MPDMRHDEGREIDDHQTEVLILDAARRDAGLGRVHAATAFSDA
jgi:hypothetical protein